MCRNHVCSIVFSSDSRCSSTSHWPPADLGPGANHFFLYYFVLTGLHLFHVCVGIGVLALLLTQARRSELSATRMAFVEGGACFWHLVDLLWIFLFALLYLVS